MTEQRSGGSGSRLRVAWTWDGWVIEQVTSTGVVCGEVGRGPFHTRWGARRELRRLLEKRR